MTKRWPRAAARAWFDALPWQTGCNFTPSYAINQREMWQAETFDLAVIERGLSLASSLGMNAVRVHLHDLLWVEDAERWVQSPGIPTIAAVQGACVSGHYELALHCDLIVAAEDANFTWIEAKAAMAPLAGGLQRLAERVGRSRAISHVMLAQTLSAREAAALGIVAVVTPADGLQLQASELEVSYRKNKCDRRYALSALHRLRHIAAARRMISVAGWLRGEEQL